MHKLLPLVFLVACGGESDPPVPLYGPPTETECPPTGTSLTYENFAAPFMEKYCTR